MVVAVAVVDEMVCHNLEVDKLVAHKCCVDLLVQALG